jgi:transposase
MYIPALGPNQLQELESLYRTSEDARLRIRALIVLLAAEQQLGAGEIARLVRYHEHTVRRWLARYTAQGIGGLRDAPKPGAPPKITESYRQELMRVLGMRPSELGLSFQAWTAPKLAEHLQRNTGIRVSLSSIYRLLREQPAADQQSAPELSPPSSDLCTTFGMGSEPLDS